MSPKEGHLISEEQKLPGNTQQPIFKLQQRIIWSYWQAVYMLSVSFWIGHTKSYVWNKRFSTLALTQTWHAAVQYLLTHQMVLGGWFLKLLTSCVSSMELLELQANDTPPTRALMLQGALLEDILLLCPSVLVTTLPSQDPHYQMLSLSCSLRWTSLCTHRTN